jgi:hypothetical protein
MTLVLLGLFLVAVQGTATTEPPIQMVIRVFDGTEEVTEEARIHIYPAGTRESPVAGRLQAGKGLIADVVPGMYDVQVVRQRDGKVLNIRWAERLLVIRYPDEPGEHLQVINLKPGFGALQVRPPGQPGGGWPSNIRVSVFSTGERTTEAAKPLASGDYVLFVLPAGKYDLMTSHDSTVGWTSDIEVPLDRTRLRQLSIDNAKRQ